VLRTPHETIVLIPVLAGPKRDESPRC
jgi:hypothetical protein